MATSAQTLITSAIALGYDALGPRDLMECLLVAAQSGGGGGTGAFITGAGSPVGSLTPTGDTLYVNTTNGSIWYWAGAVGPWVEDIA